jgi:drug/metabolite transporter (DMT)-like permease
MLLTTVLLWGLNLSVTRYLLTHGFEPLSYAVIRYGAAGALFVLLALVLERSLRVDRSLLGLVVAAAVILWLNQLAFVYALDEATASTLGLILGSTPIFAALVGRAMGVERMGGRFWLAASVSFGGVALVAAGSGGEVGGGLRGTLLGVGTSATWATYSVAITPLMERHSPYRVSAVVLSLTWIGLLATGAGQTADQPLDLGWTVWLLFGFAVLGPLVTTNVLWFTSLHRIGPSRATLAANLQPFVAAVLGVVLLDESLTLVQIAGGVLIAVGIGLARRRRRPPADSPAPPTTAPVTSPVGPHDGR